MTLEEYIEKIKLENSFNKETSKIEDYVEKKAEKMLNRQNGCIDDETVKAWIIEFCNQKEEIKQETKEKVVSVKEEKEVKGQWGQQTSIF